MRDVGTIGERTFEIWCSSASLTANRSEIDRTGWDYLVEFPRADADGQPADLLPAPLECRVQVKATDKQRKNWAISLQNLERLVKTPMPAFICIIEFASMDVAQSAYLIPVGEKLIRRILKRLREQHKAGSAKAKKPELSIAYGDSERLAHPDGANLKQAIESHVAHGFEKYYAWKRQLLETLGYEHGRGYVNMQVSGRDPIQDLIDLSLGLRKSVKVDGVSMHDVRFKVDCLLPLPSGPAEVSMSPATRKGIVAFRERKSSPAVEFLASVHLPSINRVLPRDRFVVRIETRFFDIILEPFKGMARFTLAPGIFETPVELSSVMNVLRLLHMFHTQTSQGVWMDITIDGIDLDGRIKGPVDQEVPHSAEGLEAAEQAVAIAQAAGIANRVLISIDRLVGERAQIMAFYDATMERTVPLTLRFSVDGSLSDIQARSAVILQARLGLGEYLVYCFFSLIGRIEQIDENRYSLTSEEKSCHRYAWTKRNCVMDDAEQAEYDNSVKRDVEAMKIASVTIGPTLVFEGENDSGHHI